MPTINATITKACRDGAGVLRLESIRSPAPSGAEYAWIVLDKAGNDLGGSFEQSELPIEATDLPDGSYSVVVTATMPGATTPHSASPTTNWQIACGSPLVLAYATPTPATSTGGGTVKVGGSGGTNPLTARLVELSLSLTLTPGSSGLEALFTNVPAGTYTVRLTDTSGQQLEATVTVDPYVAPVRRGCTDRAATNYDPAATEDDGTCEYPAVVPRPPAYFEVPPMQSLRYVIPGSTTRPDFDNVLLANERPLDYTVEGYCQKVEQGDTLVLQCQSNYAGVPVLELRRQPGAAVALTVPGIRVQQGQGIEAEFEAYFKKDPSGRTRIYFNADVLPLPFEAGQRLTITGTTTTLDGTYPIRSVLEDPAAAVPYLVIEKPFPGTVRLDGAVRTTYTVQAFDTYQFVVDFGSVAPGCYDSRISAQDDDYPTAVAISEPLDVASEHPHTKLITYRNFDNAWGLDYSNGLVNRLRVVARFFRRRPAGETTVLRNDNSELELLAASAYRHIELETLLLPDWLHEVLFVAFKHDSVKVDDLRVVLEGAYEYEPVERYTLGKGTATLEARGFLGAGNRDDLGDVDGGPFLLANQRFLKVNI